MNNKVNNILAYVLQFKDEKTTEGNPLYLATGSVTFTESLATAMKFDTLEETRTFASAINISNHKAIIVTLQITYKVVAIDGKFV